MDMRVTSTTVAEGSGREIQEVPSQDAQSLAWLLPRAIKDPSSKRFGPLMAANAVSLPYLLGKLQYLGFAYGAVNGLFFAGCWMGLFAVDALFLYKAIPVLEKQVRTLQQAQTEAKAIAASKEKGGRPIQPIHPIHGSIGTTTHLARNQESTIMGPLSQSSLSALTIHARISKQLDAFFCQGLYQLPKVTLLVNISYLLYGITIAMTATFAIYCLSIQCIYGPSHLPSWERLDHNTNLLDTSTPDIPGLPMELQLWGKLHLNAAAGGFSLPDHPALSEDSFPIQTVDGKTFYEGSLPTINHASSSQYQQYQRRSKIESREERTLFQLGPANGQIQAHSQFRRPKTPLLFDKDEEGKHSTFCFRFFDEKIHSSDHDYSFHFDTHQDYKSPVSCYTPATTTTDAAEETERGDAEVFRFASLPSNVIDGIAVLRSSQYQVWLLNLVPRAISGNNREHNIVKTSVYVMDISSTSMTFELMYDALMTVSLDIFEKSGFVEHNHLESLSERHGDTRGWIIPIAGFLNLSLASIWLLTQAKASAASLVPICLGIFMLTSSVNSRFNHLVYVAIWLMHLMALTTNYPTYSTSSSKKLSGATNPSRLTSTSSTSSQPSSLSSASMPPSASFLSSTRHLSTISMPMITRDMLLWSNYSMIIFQTMLDIIAQNDGTYIWLVPLNGFLLNHLVQTGTVSFMLTLATFVSMLIVNFGIVDIASFIAMLLSSMLFIAVGYQTKQYHIDVYGRRLYRGSRRMIENQFIGAGSTGINYIEHEN